MKPLRVGVVGLGWAGETHLNSYLRLPNVEAVALAGLEELRLRELGERYGVPNLYRDYGELVARDDLDAVSICAPNHLHAPVANAALKSGKHVLCENWRNSAGWGSRQATWKPTWPYSAPM